MEIPNIEELNQPPKIDISNFKRGTQETSSKEKECIYYPDIECAPGKYSMCENCPYGYMCCIPAVIKNVYQKIIGLTMMFLNQDVTLKKLLNKFSKKIK